MAGKTGKTPSRQRPDLNPAAQRTPDWPSPIRYAGDRFEPQCLHLRAAGVKSSDRHAGHVLVGGGSPTNVSLRLAVSLAWLAEPLGLASPPTQRMWSRTPLVLVACSRVRHAA